MDHYEPDDLSKDTAFSLVADERRRIVVRLMLDRRDEWDVPALAEAVADRERDGSPDTVDEEVEKRIRIALLHRHLPKLDDAGVVTFDFNAETVAPRDRLDELAPLV
jgi:hypothetical protein